MDRYVNLPEAVILLLKKYYMEFRPKDWLFEEEYGGKYSLRSVQSVFKNVIKKAKFRKNPLGFMA